MLSVIVPVFNSEQFIERCARSLLNQTLDGIEYIFVDDFSPDNSVSLLQGVMTEFPGKDVSIVRHTVNRGAFEARRTGIAAATGEYLIFVDSDDWVEGDMYRLMVDKAIATETDLVVCDFFYSYSDGKEVIEQGYCSEDIVSDILTGRVHGSMCNKMFRKKLFDSLDVAPSHFMWDDVVVTIQLASKCRRVEYVNEPLYHYFQYKNEHALSIPEEFEHKRVHKLWEDAYSNANLVLQFLEKSGMAEKYSKDIDYFRLRVMLYYYPLIAVSANNRIKFSSVYPNLAIRVLFNKKILLKTRLGFLARRCYALLFSLF